MVNGLSLLVIHKGHEDFEGLKEEKKHEKS